MRTLLAFLLAVVAFPQTTDRRVGVAAFQIVKRDGELMMHPLVSPDFKLEWLSGSKVPPDGITQCTVIARDTVNEPAATVFTFTVLRCGDAEYGIKEIDFAFDNVKVDLKKK